MQVQTGETLSAPQKLANVRTASDNVSIGIITTVEDSLSYFLDKVRYDNSTNLLTTGSIMFSSERSGTTLTGSGATLTSDFPFNSVVYRPQSSITTGVLDVTIPQLIDDTYNFKFEAGITITNVLPKSATIILSDCIATNFSISTDDYILIINTITEDVPLQLIPIGTGWDPVSNTITVNLVNLTEGSEYSLSAYYMRGNLYIPDRMSIGGLNTPLTVSFTVGRPKTRNDLLIILNNFIYIGETLTDKVFPIDDTLNSITAYAYNSNNKDIKYTVIPSISGGSVSLRINSLSFPLSFTAPSIDRLSLTYVNRKSDSSLERTEFEDIHI